MKIGDQPVNANSVENLYGAKGDSDSWERASLGITLRQYYSGNAPQMPDWFEDVFQFEQFKSPLTDEEWLLTSVYRREDYGHDEFERAADLHRLHAAAITEHQNKRRIAMYFAWRTFYADALLAELEKQNEN